MALVLKDRVQETTTTTGQGTITLAGAVAGFQSFAAIGNANTTYYTIVGGTQWEMGIGTYTSSGTTLSRDTVISNSLGDTTKIDFTAGTKLVFCTYPAEKALYVDGSSVAAGSTATIPNSLTTAASANGASTIVARDASGNFSAATVTANLTGTASNATVLQTARNFQISNGATAANVSFDGSGAVNLNVTALNGTAVSSGIVGVTYGGTGANTLTLNNVILGNTTNAVQFVAPGTSGNVLTSDGTTWASTAPGGGFAAGTRMIFAQDAAPTGWTKDTTNYNEHAIRIVTGTAGGTGGTVNFTTAFASQAVSGTVGTSGATTLATTDIPSHSHTQRYYASGGGCGYPAASFSLSTSNSNIQTIGPSTGSTGGGGSHTHSGGTFTGTAINLAVKYLNCITATKN